MRDPTKPLWITRLLRWAAVGAGALALLAGVLWGAWQWRFGYPPARDEVTLYNRFAWSLQDANAEQAWPVYVLILREELGYSALHISERGNALAQALADPRVRITNFGQGEWDDPLHDATRNALSRTERLLTRLDESSRIPGGFVPLNNTGRPLLGAGDPTRASSLLDDPDINSLVLSFYRVGYLHRAAMRHAAAEDDWDLVARRFSAAIRLARQWSQNPHPTLYNAALTVEYIVVDEARLLALERNLSPEACDAFLLAIEGAPRRGDAAATFPALSIATRSVTEMLVLVSEAFDSFDSNRPEPSFWHRERPRSVARGLRRYLSESAAHASLEWHERQERTAPVLESRPNDPKGLWDMVIGVTRNLSLLDSLEAEIVGVVTMLRLERFHAAHARWPDSLDELGEGAGNLGGGWRLVYDRDDGGAYRLALPPELVTAASHRGVFTTARDPFRRRETRE